MAHPKDYSPNLAFSGLSRMIKARLPDRHFRVGISFKLLAIVLGLSLTGMLTLSFLLISALKSQFIEQTKAAATNMSMILESSLQHAMFSNDEEMLNSIVERSAVNLEGGKIQIFDLQNTIRSSSSPTEIGMQIQRNSGSCLTCHTGEASQASQSVTILEADQAESGFLISATPIHNHSECSACHDPQISTLGVMIMRIPLTDLAFQMQKAYRRVGLVSFFTFSILAGLMVYALRIVVIEPIETLTRGITEIGAENLDYSVQVDSRDELGDLAKSIDAMRQQLKSSQAMRLQRNQELSILYKVATIASQFRDLQQILSQALDEIVEQMRLQTGLIYLFDEVRKRFEMIYSRGLTEWQLDLIDQKRLSVEGDLTLDVAEKGEIYFVRDMSKDAHFTGDFDDLHDRSYVNVPLKSQGKVVGTLEVVSRVEEPLSEHQVRILTILANQLGIAIDNISLLSETQRNAREALTLYRLGNEISASLELGQVLEAIARGARQVLGGDLGVVGLFDSERQEFDIRAVSGDRWSNWQDLSIPLSELESFNWKESHVWDQLPANFPASLRQMFAREQIHSLLVIPLRRADQSHGMIAVLSRQQRVFVNQEVHLLVRLAQQVVVALENARLYQQVRNMAVLEERDRLAREMHDELAQELGYLNLKASLTLEQLSSGEAGHAQASLQEIKEIVLKAYTNTRESIFNLRNTTSPGTDLFIFLQEYLAEYSLHYGLEAQLEDEVSKLSDVPAEVALQINCIIQESLTNIRKHAQASHVWVRLERQGDLACVVIEDDGSGFDQEKTRKSGQDHYGLQIMSERAESVGASLEMESELGRGTRVKIYLPKW